MELLAHPVAAVRGNLTFGHQNVRLVRVHLTRRGETLRDNLNQISRDGFRRRLCGLLFSLLQVLILILYGRQGGPRCARERRGRLGRAERAERIRLHLCTARHRGGGRHRLLDALGVSERHCALYRRLRELGLRGARRRACRCLARRCALGERRSHAPIVLADL